VAGYDDGRVACEDREIVIRHYYLWGAKRIGYQDIREAKVSPLGLMGKWRTTTRNASPPSSRPTA
jgi:hypothetical protein